MKLLWLSPNLNHYKAQYLNHLNLDTDIDLTVLAGSGRENMGDKESDVELKFELIETNVSKDKFGFSKLIRKELYRQFAEFDWVLIPREKKNLLLFLYALWLKRKVRWKGRKVQLVSYNHPLIKSGPGKVTALDKLLTRLYYKMYDKIIFYTKGSCELMINEGFISSTKAFWVNNTIDTKEVRNNYEFSLPNSDDPTMLFIGRLIRSKRVDICLEYYFDLKENLEKKGKILKLIIIGDGPEKIYVEKALLYDKTIEWKGALVKEKEIAPLMKRSSMVFIPGLSGLSVNHAFSYGRPYFTNENDGHGPEIEYVETGVNGFLLGNNKMKNLKMIEEYLLNDNSKLCLNAFNKGNELSIENWCKQFYASFNI